jgi:hypothetical protein
MDLAKVLHELRRELENLDSAILSLERLQQTGRRRGRPPRWLADLKHPDTTDTTPTREPRQPPVRK